MIPPLKFYPKPVFQLAELTIQAFNSLQSLQIVDAKLIYHQVESLTQVNPI